MQAWQPGWLTNARTLVRITTPSARVSSTRPYCGSNDSTVHSTPSSTSRVPTDRSSGTGGFLSPPPPRRGRPLHRGVRNRRRQIDAQPAVPDQVQSVRPRHRRQRRHRDEIAEPGRPPTGRSQQLVLPPHPIVQPRPLRRQAVQTRQHMPTPAGDHQIPPTTRQRGLRRRGEPHPVLLTDPITRTYVGQQSAPARHGQEVRDVLAPPLPGGEAQPERLSEHVEHPTGEIQRQQQMLLGNAFKAMMTARADQVLQPRTVPLPGAPREPTYRLVAGRGHRRQIPHPADHGGPGRLPRRGPPPGPTLPPRPPLTRLPQAAAAQAQIPPSPP